jgi:hypothetical protein
MRSADTGEADDPHRFLASAIVLAAVAWPAAIGAQPPAVDRDAMAALDRMGAYMRGLKSFQIQSTTSRDRILDDGPSIEIGRTVDMLVQRPNHLRVEISSDTQHRMFFFDGRNFSI